MGEPPGHGKGGGDHRASGDDLGRKDVATSATLHPRFA
jgi:hypothetical protein